MFLVILVLAASAIIGIIVAYFVRDSDVALDHSLGQMIDELPEFLANAHSNIRIATDFDSRFFDNDRVKKAFATAIGHRVDVKIITEKPPLEWYAKAKIKTKMTDKLARHVMIMDGLHVRVEKRHEPLKFGRRGDSGLLYRNFPALAGRWAAVFDKAWESL